MTRKPGVVRKVAIAVTLLSGVGVFLMSQKNGDEIACQSVVSQYNRILKLSPTEPSGLSALEQSVDKMAATVELLNVTVPNAQRAATTPLIRERLKNLEMAIMADDIANRVGNVAAACKISGIPVRIDLPEEYFLGYPSIN